LNKSRAQRVVWLLEELKLPYEIKFYKRDAFYKAPKELSNVHPLGKSPVIEIVKEGSSDNNVLAESGHIFSYLLRHYDTENHLSPTDPEEKEQLDYFLHYAEGSLEPYLVGIHVNDVGKKKAPFGTKFLMGMLTNGINQGYYIPGLLGNINFLEDIMKKQHENGSKFFVGNKLSAADIILSFPIAASLFANKQQADEIAQGDIFKKWPNLKEWCDDINKEPFIATLGILRKNSCTNRILRLDDSRANRILWALELLELDYEVKVYLRHPQTWRGPLELFKEHTLGKVPILEIIFADPAKEPIKLVETGFMMQYLLRHYDPKHVLYPADPVQQLEIDYYLHYAEGSLQHIQIALLINSVATKVVPFGLKNLTKLITKALNNGYYIHEWRLNMQYLEDRLIQNGTGFFVGNTLTAADVVLVFPVFENVFDNEEGAKEITHDKRDLKKLFPNLFKWCKLIKNNPSYIKICLMMDEEVEDLILRKPHFEYFKE
ncbi:Glutathione S-transferase 1, partial [Spathaspora sp. JA1]